MNSLCHSRVQHAHLLRKSDTSHSYYSPDRLLKSQSNFLDQIISFVDDQKRMSDSSTFDLSLFPLKKKDCTTKSSLHSGIGQMDSDKYGSPALYFQMNQASHPNKYPRHVETNTNAQRDSLASDSSDDEYPIQPVVTDLGRFVLEWTKNVPIPPYKEISTPHINAVLQWSRAPRYATASGLDTESRRLDIIVQQITATPQRDGHGTRFLLDLANIAKQHQRGVQLQQTITIASQKLSRKLQDKHGWYTSPFDKFSVFSPHPVSVCIAPKDPTA